MQIVSFLPHYQLVYFKFDLSSFSLISCIVKGHLLPCKRASFALQKGVFYNAKGHLLQATLQPTDYLMVTKPIFIQTLQDSHLSSILFVKIVLTTINLKHECCIHTQGIVPDTLLYIWNNLFLQSMRTSLPIEKLAWRLPKQLLRK